MLWGKIITNSNSDKSKLNLENFFRNKTFVTRMIFNLPRNLKCDSNFCGIIFYLLKNKLKIKKYFVLAENHTY